MRDIGDARGAKRAALFARRRDQFHAVELGRAGGEPAAIADKAHRRQTEGGFAGAGFTDQAKNLAALQVEVDPVDDRLPDIAGETFDLEPANADQKIAFFAGRGRARRLLVGGLVHFYSLSPLALCSIQSTTKLTATVKSAMAPAGNSGVMSPKVMSVAFSRTIEPQSASGG